MEGNDPVWTTTTMMVMTTTTMMVMSDDDNDDDDDKDENLEDDEVGPYNSIMEVDRFLINVANEKRRGKVQVLIPTFFHFSGGGGG